MAAMMKKSWKRFTPLFTVDKLSEGVDLPTVNVVLFLRPTESLTVFLLQLGRGLRRAPGKDCLTVLDFVGHIHRRYREESFQRLSQNPSILNDLTEILVWDMEETAAGGIKPELTFTCPLELHAHYGIKDIQVVFGSDTLATSGQRGVGVLHFPDKKVYVLLITFQKTEREFSPTTMYADYPISRELLHWESQANTPQQSTAGQNLIDHQAQRGFILWF